MLIFSRQINNTKRKDLKGDPINYYHSFVYSNLTFKKFCENHNCFLLKSHQLKIQHLEKTIKLAIVRVSLKINHHYSLPTQIYNEINEIPAD